MEIKIMFLVLLYLSLSITNGVSLNGDHQVLSSHDSARGRERIISFNGMPRKSMSNPKVKGLEDMFVSGNKNISGLICVGFSIRKLSKHNNYREESSTSSSKVTMQEGSDPARMFTMDYSHVRKRRPVHNNSLSKTTTSP